MNKFLLAENPFRPEQSGHFIVHTLKPVSIIQCTKGFIQSDKACIHKLDHEGHDWTLTAIYNAGTDEQIYLVLNRAWRWYRAFNEQISQNP